jgi:hypothetical protein
MKGYLSLVLGSLIVVLMLVSPGNTAKAAGPSSEQATVTGECGCDVSVISGAERNKMVSDLLKSDDFKAQRENLKKDGYSWNGANDIEIIQNHTHGDIILVGVPFTDEAGTEVFYAYLYMNGTFIFVGSAIE